MESPAWPERSTLNAISNNSSSDARIGFEACELIRDPTSEAALW